MFFPENGRNGRKSEKNRKPIPDYMRPITDHSHSPVGVAARQLSREVARIVGGNRRRVRPAGGSRAGWRAIAQSKKNHRRIAKKVVAKQKSGERASLIFFCRRRKFFFRFPPKMRREPSAKKNQIQNAIGGAPAAPAITPGLWSLAGAGLRPWPPRAKSARGATGYAPRQVKRPARPPRADSVTPRHGKARPLFPRMRVRRVFLHLHLFLNFAPAKNL